MKSGKKLKLIVVYICIYIVFLLFNQLNVSIMKITIGILLLFLPGLIMMEILYQEKEFLEKITYGVLASFVIDVVISLWLNIVFKIKLDSNFLTILFFSMILLQLFFYVIREKTKYFGGKK